MDMDTDSGKTSWFEHGVLQSRLVSKLVAAFLLVAIVFVGAKAINAINNFDTISEAPATVITVDGEGSIFAAPDIALVSFTISENAETAAVAQDAVQKKMNVALELVKNLEVAEEDVKTTSYSVSPRYNYQPPCYTYPCPYQEQRIIGFTATQSVDVKVRDIDSTGKVLSVLGDAGISNLFGPNFMVENEDELKADARKEAIEEARAKASELANQLGVRLVRVASYSEGGYYPGPFYKTEALGMGGAAPVADSASVPSGENEIKVNVSITYEIR